MNDVPAAAPAQPRDPEALLAAAPVATVGLDVTGRVQTWNAAAHRLLLWSPTEAEGRTLAELVTAVAGDEITADIEVATTGGTVRRDYALARRDGSRIEVDAWLAAVRDPEATVIGVVVQLTDVTSLRQQEREQARQTRELERLSRHDPVTGLPNRQALVERLEHLATIDGASYAVVLLDLDNFRLVNNNHGHEVGNQVLAVVAERMRLVAGDGAYVARLGGDELVAVLSTDAQATAAGATTVAGQLLAAVADPIDVGGRTLSLSASAGLAICPPTPVSDALQHADASMYEAKRQGRGRLHVYDPSIAARSASMLQLSNALRTALRDGAAQLTTHYQPVVDLATQRPVALEALARWHHPELGDVSPARFVDVAQQTGLAAQLDLATMARAFADYAALVAAGFVDDSTRISVNLAASHLRSPDAGDEILRTAYDAGVAPRQLMIEVNQDALEADVEAAGRALERLRAQGAWVALDEFGSGTASLANLRKLPVDVLKIDRAFIRNLTDGGDDLAIVASLIDLAHALGVIVIAEGVETADQRRLLAELKCDQAQGYLWSRPVSRAALPDVLHDLSRSVRAAEAVGRLRPRETARPAVAGREHGLLHMLELRREGRSPATIAASLNAHGFRTADGLRWQHGSVLKALAASAGGNG